LAHGASQGLLLGTPETLDAGKMQETNQGSEKKRIFPKKVWNRADSE
jgi:hypothetical protein